MNEWKFGNGPFLVLHALVLVAIVAVALVARRRVCTGWRAIPSDLDQYDIAMLNGGSRNTAAVALLSLDRTGSVELGDRLLRELASEYDFDPEEAVQTGDRLAALGIDVRVTLSGLLPGGTHPVEAAVYSAVETSTSRRPDEIVDAASRCSALQQVRARLEMMGLFVSAAEGARLRRQWRWFLPLAALGLVELFAGPEENRILVGVLLGATAGAMGLVRRSVPVRTRAGEEMLDHLRAGTHEIALNSVAVERDRAGTLLALAGPGALWAADPALALATGAEPTPPEASSRRSGDTRRGWYRGWGGWGARAGCGSGGFIGGSCAGGDGGSGCGGGGGGGCGGGGCGGGG
jgi:uncharacterized protein (TIGR04222 family)